MIFNRALWGRGLAAVGAVVLVAQVVLWLPSRAHLESYRDVDVYRDAAVRAAAGEQVYGRQARVHFDDVPAGFYYPPTALAVLRPLHGLSDVGFRYALHGLSLVSMWLLAAALVRISLGAITLVRLLISGLALSVLGPVSYNMYLGNLDMMVVAMLAWAFAAPRFAAPLIVTAAAIKIYPAFALVAWLPRADRRFRIQAIATGAAIAPLTVVMLGGLKYVREWISLGLPSASWPVVDYGNWSLSTVLIFPNLHFNTVAETPAYMRAFLCAAPFVAAVVAACCARKKTVAVASMASLVAGTWFTAFCWWWRILVLLTIPAAAWYASRSEISKRRE